MKRALLLLVVVALFFAFTLALEAQTNVRLLTYNIHRDIGASDSNISAQPALAKVVNYLNPDIWTINELGGNNVAFNPTIAHAGLVTFIHDRLTIFGANPQENVNYFIYIGTIDDGYITRRSSRVIHSLPHIPIPTQVTASAPCADWFARR